MTETMFARARAPKSNLGLAAIVVTIATLATGFLAGTDPRPGGESPELRATAAAAAPARG